MTAPLLEAIQVERRFGGGRTLLGRAKPTTFAVQSLNLSITEGETVGIVGESGCGKSTLARMLVGLDQPSCGLIKMEGRAIQNNDSKQRKELAGKVQLVFQDSVSSLNPRKTIRQILEAPMIHLLGLKQEERTHDLERLMTAVNLLPEFLDRYPHEFSGGQAQRIGIARALAARPKLLVLDEPVSALDVSVQAQILNLLEEIKAKYGLTYIFISHDLSVVEAISDRVVVMYFGSVVELASAKALFEDPKHPYTRLLFRSVPLPGRKNLFGEAEIAELPDPLNPPKGCAFAGRCDMVSSICKNRKPELEDIVPKTRSVSCFMVPRT